MACPVCGGTDSMEINVRVKQESDLKQAIGSTWDGRNMARCNECGVLYDHRYVESTDEEGEGGRNQQAPAKTNCPDCGSLNPAGRDTCTYCEVTLE